MSAQWLSSTGSLRWRADLILCGEAEGSSSVSDPEGCSLSPSWDPVSPTSSRRNLNLDKNKCHTKYQPQTISNRTISSVATNTSRVSPTLCHILRAGGWARAQRRAAERRGGMGRGCPRAAPPGGGTGRCGGGPRRDRPADLPPAGRGDRVPGGVGLGASLPPHRSGEPEPRRAERPATDGRAAMEDVEGESVSWRWRSERQALAAPRARSPETPDVNHSPRPPQLLLRSPPPPPSSSLSTHSAETQPLRGTCWEM